MRRDLRRPEAIWQFHGLVEPTGRHGRRKKGGGLREELLPSLPSPRHTLPTSRSLRSTWDLPQTTPNFVLEQIREDLHQVLHQGQTQQSLEKNLDDERVQLQERQLKREIPQERVRCTPRQALALNTAGTSEVYSTQGAGDGITTPPLAPAIGSPPARVQLTPPQALVMRSPLARVQEIPQMAFTRGTQLARVRCSPPALANPVLGLGREDLREAKTSLSWNVNDFHQLFRHLRHDGVEYQLKADPRVLLRLSLRPHL